MPDIVEIAALLGAGLAGGLLAGLLGIGGGVVYVFVLTLFLEPQIADDTQLVRFVLANSLLATFFAGLSSTLRYASKGDFNWQLILATALPGAMAALLVAWLLVAFDWYRQSTYSTFIILMLAYMAFRMLYLRPRAQKKEMAHEDEARASEQTKDGQSRPMPTQKNRKPEWWWYPVSGLTAGVVSSLSGFGGGVVIVPMLSEAAGLPIRKASSISLGVIPVFALSLSIFFAFTRHAVAVEGHYALGFILPKYVLPMVLGVWIGAGQGVNMAHRIPERLLTVLFGMLLLTVALRMAWSLF